MSKLARCRGFAILALAALIGCPGEPQSPATHEFCFQTPEEARLYALTRIRFVPAAEDAADAYSATFPRSYTTILGQTEHSYLVDTAGRELALAEGFMAHGFAREALVHYRNLLIYYPESDEGRIAGERYKTCRDQTVLGLVAPLSPILQDSKKNRYVPATRTPPLEPTLDRIHEAYLGPAASVPGALTVVGFVDDEGALAQGKNPPGTFSGGWKYQGVIARDRLFYWIPEGAKTLFDVERIAKERIPERPLNPAAIEALIYSGNPSEGLARLEHLGVEPPPDPLAGDLAAVAADPNHPLRLDALWALKALDNPSFTLTTKSCVTETGTLPIVLHSRNLEQMTFSFARLQGPVPAKESDLKKWLKTAPATPSHSVTLDVPSNRTTLRLPVLDAGTYRVTATSRGLSCTFIAVRVDTSVEILAFPAETVLRTSRGGYSIVSGQKLLGVTDAEGFAVSRGKIRPRLCEAHRECCATCVSCAHHHRDPNVLSSDPQILVTGNGQFFRATAKLDLTGIRKVKAPSTGPIALVYTDRPAYKAGDTIRFRGIVRTPQTPRHRKNSARLVPAVERELAVSIANEHATLFKQTYVTGEYGTFSGKFILPLTAMRTEYTLSASFGGVRYSHPFEVLDYRKRDFAIVLRPDAEGFRVRAGYVWGAPVPGARVRCIVNGKETALQGDLIPASDGNRVIVDLVKDGERLARKKAFFRSRKPRPKAESATPVEEAPKQEAKAAAPAKAEPKEPLPPPVFTVHPSKPIYARGEEIEVELRGPWKEAEAMVVVGDVNFYDLLWVPIHDGRGTVRFPVRPLFDPGTTVFARCEGLQAQANFQVRANEMKVAIDAPANGRPGQDVEVTLHADPNAALSLAAVDEAIYMIREDETPGLYRHFHPERPAAMAYARFGNFEFDGETFQLENTPEDEVFKEASVLLDRPFRGKGTYDVIGGGGGGGGRYGSRLGGKRNLVARGGGGSDTQDAVLGNLRGAAPLQKPDGSWESSYATEAGTLSTVGATGFTLLSYTGAGYSHLSKDTYDGICFGDVVRKGQQWLMRNQTEDGRIGPRTGDWVLNHALAALALSEAYGLTGSTLFKANAQKGIDFLVSVQSPDGGWHRSDPSANGEILASAFATMALKSAQISGLASPMQAAERTWAFFDLNVFDDGRCTDPPTRATTAAGMMAIIFLRADKTDPRLRAAAYWLLQHPPSWAQMDFLGWYLASLALFQYDGPSGPVWKGFNERVKNTLVRNQGSNGLWVHRNDGIGPTALASLTLEVYYRYANVFGTNGGSGTLPPLAPPARVRVSFPDTAFWAPDLITDDKGTARVSFTLPDTITTTRLTARGTAKTGAAGEAVARIRARQPFFIKLRCPQFAVLGDEIEIRAELFNYTLKEMEATVRLEGRNAQTLTVPLDRPAGASWRVRADDPAGLRLRVHARSSEHSDAIERVVPVRRAEQEIWRTIRGASKAGGTFTFDAPEGTQDIVVKAHPKRGSLTKLLDALRYLNGYPYG